jgi:3-hydroxyisobutyrate dehydrogenase-like beta-hydroxyacid dehydrogenase
MTAPPKWGAVHVCAIIDPMTRDGTTVGMHGAGHMGAGLGWALREGGARVVTTLAGRSARTGKLVADAGLEPLDSLDAVVAAADVVLVVVPPEEARAAATALAGATRRTGHRPLVADLNAIAPSTVEDVAAILAGCDFVDGSISGGPPTSAPGARIYLSGDRAADVAALPWRHVQPVVVAGGAGRASAVKMCTASVYKGTTALLMQAIRTAAANGVLDEVLADLAAGGFPEPARRVAVSATKARRFVPEMREIAATQRAAGLPAALFEGIAEVYARIVDSELAALDPESVDRSMSPATVVSRLAGRRSR